MITLFFIVFTIIIIAMICANNHGADYDESLAVMITIDLMCIVGMIILLVNLFIAACAIPNKIAMYQEENAIIEERVSSTVAKYMEYEKDIIYEVAPSDDAMTLISLYPELSSDELIKEEINVYVSNNNKIRELKDAELNKSIYKFLLYFGH
jgi:hypothetical protein